MKQTKLFVLLFLLVIAFGHSQTPTTVGYTSAEESNHVLLPIIFGKPPVPVLQVNAPYFPVSTFPNGITQTDTNQTAIFWFGRVFETENYADVRVGYTPSYLFIRVTVFDRQVWYDTTPSLADLTSWDATTLYLNLNGNADDTLNAQSYSFSGQFRGSGQPVNYQAAYQGSGGGWSLETTSFTTSTSLEGSFNNNSSADYGWSIIYSIPFTSLELGGAPAQGTVWGMGLALHDRDDATGSNPIQDKTWPPTLETTVPSSWAKLSFGLPTTTATTHQPDGSTIIRHGENGAIVKDAMVGGNFNCGAGLYSYGEWGEENYNGAYQINIQNQFNYDDWPCFSKYYVTFPLNSLPANVQISSATLSMMHFSNAGGSGNPVNSLLQVLTVANDWDEATINWNNAPLAVENVSQLWVPSYYGNPPPAARIWDISSAVVEAFAAGQPLRLAIYSADYSAHSGKYFLSSDTGNSSNRPTLTVNWASP
jgi:hypothetical protein